ncbi:MIB [Mytilus coruscus]|uniref:MIB n=1 Tax=Mytilus coruscus TaxID=42192 RepID=A0A6J8BNP7_MYTCO|nr:MIB [Mytilus coruscus]
MATDLPGSSIDLKYVYGNTFYDSDNDGDKDANSQQKEIQNDPQIDEQLSVYSTFLGDKVLKAYAGENIEVGLRVVRPQSWKPESDYKFGNGREIGTIVNLTESGDVQVQWDTGGNDDFAKGNNNQFDLLLFDNAQTGVKHTKVQCDACGVHPLRRIRWKCMICRDYDLCTDCYMSDEHDHTHILKRMLSTDSKGEQMPPRENQEFNRALGIQPNAYVHLHSDPKHKGRVEKYLENDIETYRSDANVKWNDNLKGRYRVGRNGQCDLKFIDAAKGPMYYEDHLPIATFENVQKGARVVRGPGWDDSNDRDGGHEFVGTVTNVGDFKGKENITLQERAVKNRHRKRISTIDVLTYKHDVLVQWDNGNKEEYNLSSTCLRLFDNGPSGVEHEGYVCDCCPKKDNHIHGIRWKCITCHDFDLCNICYMSDKHDLGHKFQRIVAANLREDMQTSREHPRSSVRQSYGIFKDARVVEVAQEKSEPCAVTFTFKRSIIDEKQGTIIDICGCKVDTGRSEVAVKWGKHGPTRSHRILDLKYDKGGAFYYYYDHLPILGSEKTKLPCHVVGQKVLFHSGSTSAVFIHYKTEKDTVKELVKKSFRTFDRGDIDEKDEDEIHYFKRMAEYVQGEAVLPVLISFRNGGMRKEVINSAAKSKIPIIRLKKHSLDVSLLTADKSDGRIEQMTEHITDLKNPWSIKTSEQRDHKLGKYDGQDDLDEIALISQIQGDFCDNLDTLVCCLIIGGRKIELNVSTSELYGLILYALLKKQYWSGARQLIETGCIRIRQILIACVVLEDQVQNWRTSPHLKEKLQRFKRLTRKKKKDSMKIQDNKLHDHDDDLEHKEEKKLGEHINHAGRLLVNHGYIEDAIKTHNKTFLDNSTVKNILNEMWYGTEKLDFRTLGFLTLNTAYAYMLLFDNSDEGITYSDYFIIVWMAQDTVSFMMIMVVIMMCYNISFSALLYPNSEFSWLQIEKITQNGYWMLFGELNLDSDTLSEPHCTFNRAVYESTDIQRCPEQLGVYIAPYLKALYGLIAVILLLNLLIAMYREIDLTEVDRITLTQIAISIENIEVLTEDEDEHHHFKFSSSSEDDSDSQSVSSEEYVRHVRKAEGKIKNLTLKTTTYTTIGKTKNDIDTNKSLQLLPGEPKTDQSNDIITKLTELTSMMAESIALEHTEMQEIQGHAILNGRLSEYVTFHGYSASYIPDIAKDVDKLPVVNKDDTNKPEDLRTVVNELETDQVVVELDNDGDKNETIRKDDLILSDGAQTGADGYFEVNIRGSKSANKKIKVFIWRPIQKDNQKKEVPFKPSLYLIIDSPEEDENVNKISLMEEIIDFAKKTKLPCHIVKQRVLFHNGYKKTASIHYKTDKETIEELIKKGFNEFERLDENIADEIHYFRRMAEYAIGEEVLPIIISLKRNHVIKQEVLNTAQTYQIPLIYLKPQKKTQDVNILWPTDGDDQGNAVITEYKTDTTKPWRVKKLKEKNTQKNSSSDGIALLSEIHGDLDILISHILVGVCFKEKSSTERKDDKYTNDYATALSMYLLKKGKWTISKKDMRKLFSQKSVEYIYEEVVTSEFIKKLCRNQSAFSRLAYKLPEHPDIVCEMNNEETVEIERTTKGKRVQLIEWDTECNGLIFFALLQKRYWTGALQLVETGCVGIHHILVGCVLLDDEVINWKTTTALKEKLQLLKSAFTERAIGITSCIYEEDKNAENNSAKETEIDSIEKIAEDRELDDNINHAGRLLLNHGYLRDAINTENNTFLKNDTVRKVLNKQWFYKKYKLPFLKVVIHMLGFLVLLIAYAYMLLFDYSDDRITSSDCFIIVLITSFVVDEIKQVIVAFLRGQLKSYASDWWNTLDWLFNIAYTLGMILRTGEGSGFRNTSKCLLLLAFMILCVRILNICCMTEFLGPKLVIIRKMIKQTVAFMIIMTVIVVWYSVSFYALLYSNSEFSWKEIEKILSNGYWMLFGELNLDGKTDGNGNLQRSATKLGEDLTPYLKALYGLIAVVLLLNLLIALYSDTFNVVQQQSEFYWRQIQTDFLEEYSIRTVYPIHLQLLALPGIITAIIWLCYSNLRGKLSNKYNMHEGKAKLNHRPMLVRVFLYDTNYDLKLKSTEDAEEKGALDNKGKIDLEDFDAIATMNKITDSLKDLKEKKHMRELDSKRADRRNQETMNKLDKIEDSLKDIQEMKKMLMERQQNMEIMLQEIMKKLDIETKGKTNRDTVDISDEARE